MSSSTDLSTSSFKDIFWLQYNVLNEFSVMDYFSTSPFYDRSCNNEILKMQSKYNTAVNVDYVQKIKEMVGIEYELVHAKSPMLFVIRKQQRKSRVETNTLASYYVLDGSIYQAPDFYSVVSNRLTNCLFYIREAVEELKDLIKFDAVNGYEYPIISAPSAVHSTAGKSHSHILYFKEKAENVAMLQKVAQSLTEVLGDAAASMPASPCI